MKSAFYFSAILAVSLTSYCAFRCSFNENFMGEEKRRFFKYLLSITIHHLSFIPSYEYFVSNMRNRRKSNAFQAFNRWWKSFSSLRNLNHFVRTHSLWCVPRLSLPRSYCDQFFFCKILQILWSLMFINLKMISSGLFSGDDEKIFFESIFFNHLTHSRHLSHRFSCVLVLLFWKYVKTSCADFNIYKMLLLLLWCVKECHILDKIIWWILT